VLARWPGAGDEAALARLYEAFRAPRVVHSRAGWSRRTRRPQDIAQDVFVDMLTRLHQYEGRGSFAGWVRSITVSRCLMHLRSPWHKSRRWLDRLLDESVPVLDQMEQLPAPSTDRSDQIDLERALVQLGETARAVVWLHDVEGYTHGEIGALFGATASFPSRNWHGRTQRCAALLRTRGVEASCMPVSNNC
jgi:RNA polymerase sigma-70 factor (ECF subfamily)